MGIAHYSTQFSWGEKSWIGEPTYDIATTNHNSILKSVINITNHIRDYVLTLEKYKAMQNNSMSEDRNGEDYNFLLILFLKLKLV